MEDKNELNEKIKLYNLKSYFSYKNDIVTGTLIFPFYIKNNVSVENFMYIEHEYINDKYNGFTIMFKSTKIYEIIFYINEMITIDNEFKFDSLDNYDNIILEEINRIMEKDD